MIVILLSLDKRASHKNYVGAINRREIAGALFQPMVFTESATGRRRGARVHKGEIFRFIAADWCFKGGILKETRML